MSPGFLFSLLITGISCVLHEHHDDAYLEYYRLERQHRRMFLPLVSAPEYHKLPEDAIVRKGGKVTAPRTVTISRHGETGLHFEIMDSTSDAAHRYLSDEGVLVVSWFKFEFNQRETLLTIHFGNLHSHDKEHAEILTPVYFPRSQQSSAAAIILEDEEPATVGEITDIINQDNMEVKTAVLNIDWIPGLFFRDQPRLIDPGKEDENGEKIVKYLCLPIVVNRQVLEKLLELKDHLHKTIVLSFTAMMRS